MAHPDPGKAGYYFLGWYNGDTAFDFESGSVSADITLTAKWVEITNTELSIREKGPHNEEAEFDYPAVYARAGLGFDSTTATITVDEPKLYPYIANPENQGEPEKLFGTGSLNTTICMGIAYKTPEVTGGTVTQVAFASDVASLKNADSYRELASHPSCCNNTLISYMPIETVNDGVVTITEDDASLPKKP